MNKLYARITGTDLYRLVEVDADGNLKVASSGGGGGGASTVADGADVTQGAIADVKVTGDSSGTVEGKLRGLNYLWALVIDTANSWLKVSIQNASLAVTGTFWQATQPVSASPETSTVYNGATALTPKFAKIAAASSGDNTLVAAVTNKKIRVLAAVFIGNGTVNAKFQSGASGTDLSGLFYMAVNSGAALPFNPAGWFETASTTLLNLNLSGAIAVGGCITYVEV